MINDEEVTTAPRDAATVVLLRDAPAGLEVLMVRRHRDSQVLGDAFVFPGGKVDEADAGLEPRHSPATAGAAASPDDSAGPDDTELHGSLGEPTLAAAAARAIFAAAARETAEEVAVRLPLGLLRPWVRWITPRVPAMMKRRFDTRFFLAALPPGAEARHDAYEAVESRWLAPREALERYWAREMVLAPPQIQSLAHLARHRDMASAFTEAASRMPPLVEPRPFALEGERMIAYPGDPEHPLPTRAFPGPSRLAVRNDRFEPLDGFEGFFR